MTFHWYYVWSPKYEVFHHILLHSLKDISGILLHPVFIPQSFFEQKPDEKSIHFFSGITLKQDVLLKALQNHPDEHIIVSDVDLIIQNEEGLVSYLQQYTANDITFMADSPLCDLYNIGFGLFKSNLSTIHFVESLISKIKDTRGHDQTLVNELLPTFQGKVGMFSIPEVVQSNMQEAVMHPFYICQALASTPHREAAIFEKLLSYIPYFDLSDVRQYISLDMQKGMAASAKQIDPEAPTAQWEF